MKIKGLFIYCVMMTSIMQISARSLLSILETYAQSLPEVVSVPLDWQYPNFQRFFEAHKKTFFARLMQKIGMAKQDPWLKKNFLEISDALSKEYGQLFAREPIYSFEPLAEQTILLWGPLHGSFHSVVRTLRHLAEKEIINEDLVIQKKQLQMVFMGDMTDRSAYPLETLYVLCMLAFNNKGKVYLLKSKSETDGRWLYESLGHQLNAWQRPDIMEAVNALFAQLPSALRFADKQTSYGFLITSLNALAQQNIVDNLEAIDHRAFLHDEGLLHIQGSTLTGLDQLFGDDNSLNWIVTSSANQVFKKFYNFDEDAYVEIAIPAQLKDTKLRVIKSKVGDQQFVVREWRNIFTGVRVDAQYEKQIPFFVGSTLGLSQGVVTMSQNAKLGMSEAIMHANDDMSMGDYYIALSIIDDQYRAANALKNIQYFIKRDIDTILMPTGSPTLQYYLSLVKEGKVNVFFPLTGGPQFRDEANKHIIHLRASYADEVAVLMKHLYEEQGATNFLFFYQDDAFGKGPLKAAHEFLQKHGITKWVDVPYNRTTTDFSAMAAKIKESDPQAIGFFSITTPTQEVLSKLGNEFFIGRSIFGVSFLGEVSLRSFLKDQGLHMFFAQVVPNPVASTLPIVQEYRKVMDQKGYFYDLFSLEGYIGASIFIEAIKKAPRPLTADGIMKVLESFNAYPFKGLTLTFDPKRRTLTPGVWLEKSYNHADWTFFPINKQ